MIEQESHHSRVLLPPPYLVQLLSPPLPKLCFVRHTFEKVVLIKSFVERFFSATLLSSNKLVQLVPRCTRFLGWRGEDCGVAFTPRGTLVKAVRRRRRDLCGLVKDSVKRLSVWCCGRGRPTHRLWGWCSRSAWLSRPHAIARFTGVSPQRVEEETRDGPLQGEMTCMHVATSHDIK